MQPSPPAPLTSTALHARVLRVVWITLFINLANALAKFVIGGVTANLTVIADAVNALLDGANNIVGLFTLKKAYEPPDADHPYGHRKFEAVASLAIGGVMALTSWEIFKSNLKFLWSLRSGTAHNGAHFSLVGLCVILGSIGVNSWLCWYERARGRELGSQFLLADAAHTRSDLFVAGLSISSLILAPRWPLFDVTLSMIIVLVVLHSGWKVITDNLQLLTDTVQMDTDPIREVVDGVDGVRNSHAIRTHGMPDEIHLDLHIVVDPSISALEAMQIEQNVREALMDKFPQVAEVAIHHQVTAPKTERPHRRPGLDP